MKKVIGIILLMVVIAAITTMYSANAETIVRGYDPWDVANWVDEWAGEHGYEVFINKQGELINDCFIARGVVINTEFHQRYGVDFDVSTCKTALEKEYGPIDMGIAKVGEYEGYDVFVIEASANTPIGTCYSNDEVVEYFKTIMLFMVVE